MSHAHSFFYCLSLFLLFSAEGSFYGQFLAHCQSNAYDGHDAMFVEQYYFNKVLELQYNGSSGKTIGYTKKAKEIADTLNKIPSYLKHQVWKTELCRRNSKMADKGLLNSVEPYVRLRSVETEGGKHPAMLLCSAYNFYPKRIKVTWLRDGKTVTSYVTSTDELSNGNWLYQIHSYLEYTPRPGERITCMVEHASFKEPKLYDWGSIPDPQKFKFVVGSAGLVLGLVLFLTGVIYYRTHATGRELVPCNEIHGAL